MALPKGCTEEHLEFLDELRDEGVTNMYGAVPYIVKEFPGLDHTTASRALTYWMLTYTERVLAKGRRERRAEDGQNG